VRRRAAALGNGYNTVANKPMLILLSFTEAAERLGVHPDECFEFIQNGQLSSIKVASSWYIDERLVEELRRKRQTPPAADPYSIANQFLYPRTRLYPSLTNKEFADIISEVSTLPPCDTRERRALLEASRLLASLPLLANAIGRTLVSEVADDRKAMHTQRLRALWNACEPVVGTGLDGRGYAAFLITASKGSSDDPTLFVDIATAAQRNGRGPGDFVWKDPTEMEANVLDSARYAIRTRDQGFLQRCFTASRAIGSELQPVTWAQLAKQCGEVRSADLLGCVWTAATTSQASFGAREWSSFFNAAAKCETNELAETIFRTWDKQGRLSANVLLGGMSQALAEVGHVALLNEVIDVAVRSKDLTSATWGGLFNAASELDDEGEALCRLYNSCRDQKARLDAAAIGSLAAASGSANRRDILIECWTTAVESGVPLNAIAWGTLATAAADCDDAALLEAVFEAWMPTSGTLQRAEHGIWGSFFQAAGTLNRADLLLKFFEKLESLIDHTLLRHRGTLDPLLWSLCGELEDRNVAAQIEDALSGARLDTDHCFNVLSSRSPSENWEVSGQYEGAGRCLMRWLINHSFRPGVDFDEIASNFTERVCQVEQNRSRLWHSLVCRSQESYVGCLRRRCLNQLGQSVAYLDSLTPGELVAEVRKADNGVLARVVEFLHSGIADVTPVLQRQDACVDAEQNELIAYLVQNQKTFLRSHLREDPSTFFETTFTLVQKANLETMSPVAAKRFLFCLIREMSAAVWDELFEPFRKGVHSAKNVFIQQFAAVLDNENLPSEAAEEVALSARRFLRNLGNALRESAPREAKAINVAFDVLIHLIGQRGRLPTTSVDVPRPFHIAAWDGAKRDTIIPLLRELRTNAETALRRLPQEQQFFEVSLREAGDEEGYAVLTVANAWDGSKSQSEHSTGIGLGAIQRWANRFEYSGRVGFAVPDTEARSNGTFWVWRVYLPLLQPEEDLVS
jgi:hypothetical protein